MRTVPDSPRSRLDPRHGGGLADGSPPSACANCAAPLSGRFCAACGEKRVEADDYALRNVAGELAEQFFSFDGRIVRTVRVLLTRPRMLTAEYLAGRRQTYAKPMSPFLLMNVAFFFAAGRLGLLRWNLQTFLGASLGPTAQRLVAERLAARHVSMAQYAASFDVALDASKRTSLLFVVPALAVVVALIERRARRHYMEHVVFAIHLVAFLLLVMVTAMPAFFIGLDLALRAIARVVAVPSPIARFGRGADDAILLFLVVVLGVYVRSALRRVYHDTGHAAAWRSALVIAGLVAVLVGYRYVAFFAAVATT